MDKELMHLLKNPNLIGGIQPDLVYTRQHDDTDGGEKGFLVIKFSRNLDAWISIDCNSMLLFKNSSKSQSPHTYAAIKILANGIQLDNGRKVETSIEKILEQPAPQINTNNWYFERIHDGDIHDIFGRMSLEIADCNSDAIFSIDFVPIRFRSYSGSILNQYTYTALRILALAMHLDDQQNPQE